MSLSSTFIRTRKTPLARVTGSNTMVPLADGTLTRYINLDNAASTPVLKPVHEFIQNYLPWYSSVHRGTGFKSQLSTKLYDQTHEITSRFVGADPESHTVIFTKNTTEAINKLSCRFPFKEDSVVLSTGMEHHSNDLPWRDKTKTVHIKTEPNGNLDLEDLHHQLKKYNSRVALVCVSGASNVTGLIQPIHEIAELVHQFGAKILVDAAQLAPHRKINVKPKDNPAHIDFLVFSAHKMYAPFGTGALITPKELFLDSAPEYSGGGTVQSVTLDEVAWAGLPDREEAGSPNVIGAVALAKAITELEKTGMDRIASHEKELTHYALTELKKIDQITIYGDPDTERVGVISFTVEGISHFKIAAALSYEYGIGVRNGCFCAHPYVVRLLGLEEEDVRRWKDELSRSNKSQMPGLIRISFGCYNTLEDVRKFISATRKILDSGFRHQYVQHKESGEYLPADYSGSTLDKFLKVQGLGYH